MRAPEFDNCVGRFGFMRGELRQLRIAPVGQVDDSPELNARLGGFGRLDDVESLPVEKKRVISEQLVELRDPRVIIGNRLRFDLTQNSLHLCGSQFHRRLLRICTSHVAPRDKGPDTSKSSRALSLTRYDTRKSFQPMVNGPPNEKQGPSAYGCVIADEGRPRLVVQSPRGFYGQRNKRGQCRSLSDRERPSDVANSDPSAIAYG